MIYRRHQQRCPHRADGRRHWLCKCPIGFDGYVNGERINRSTRLRNWEKAQVLAEKWARGDFSGVGSTALIPKCKEEPIAAVAALEKFLAQIRIRNLSRTTEYKYELLGKRLLDFARRNGILLLRDFNLDVLEAFLAEWTEGAICRLKKLERLKAFFRACHIRGWIDENPAMHLRGPKIRPRPTLPFTQEEMKRILDAVKAYPDKSGKMGRPNSIRLFAFVLLLRYTGLRIGDVTSLTVDRISGNKILLYTQKTGQPVFCVIPDFVEDALENSPRSSDKYFFWTGRSTLHTAIGIWQRTLRTLFKLAGITNGHAHRFRDTFAVELLLSGVSTEEVATLLGHSNIAITQRHYSPWVRSRQQQLEANLQKAWNRDPIALLHSGTGSKLPGRSEVLN
jgi:integrase/recombinase XerD